MKRQTPSFWIFLCLLLASLFVVLTLPPVGGLPESLGYGLVGALVSVALSVYVIETVLRRARRREIAKSLFYRLMNAIDPFVESVRSAMEETFGGWEFRVILHDHIQGVKLSNATCAKVADVFERQRYVLGALLKTMNVRLDELDTGTAMMIGRDVYEAKALVKDAIAFLLETTERSSRRDMCEFLLDAYLYADELREALREVGDVR